MILPERINKSPLGPFVRQDDPNWSAIVRWTVNALVAAEELGVTAANADSQAQGADAQVRRLLGTEPGIGKSFGLTSSGRATPSRPWATTARSGTATWARPRR